MKQNLFGIKYISSQEEHGKTGVIKRRRTILPVNERVVDFVVESNSALQVVELNSFQNLFHKTEQGQVLKTADSLREAIRVRLEKFQLMLKDTLSNKLVAVTADAWTSYNK